MKTSFSKFTLAIKSACFILLCLLFASAFKTYFDSEANLFVVAAGIALLSFTVALLPKPQGSLFDLINAADLTFTGEEIRSFAEMFMQTLIYRPELTSIHRIESNIVARKQIGIVGTLSKITKKDPGCGLGVTPTNIPLSQKYWDPVQTKIWIQFCADILENTFMTYLKNKGIKRKDVTDTTIAAFVLDKMTEAAVADVWRIAWFSDTTHTNVGFGSGTEQIKAGVSITDYNIIDGFWKQLYAVVAANSARRTTISENAEASYALQIALAAGKAKTIFGSMLTAADPRLAARPDKIILATKSLTDNYVEYLESQGVDASYVRIEGGYNSLRRRGVNIIEMTHWDDTIRSDFDNGTVYYLPHRAVLTVPENLPIGFDDPNGVKDFDVFYDKMTETNNFKGAYKIDAKEIMDYLIQVAY